MLTQNQARSILREVYKYCNALCYNRVQDAYLYGDYARGDIGAESELDILLTVDMEQEEMSQCRKEMSLLSSELSLAYDITVYITVKPIVLFYRYQKLVALYQEVIREGIRIGKKLGIGSK